VYPFELETVRIKNEKIDVETKKHVNIGEKKEFYKKTKRKL